MATSGEAIKTAILAEMGNHPDTFVISHEALRLFVECVAKGIYAELQKLEDVPPAPCSMGAVCPSKTHI
ncbi:hypothetical protein [Desulfocurvibacter africanus]|uniref:Uncharacterized protein n=1 Tax=Desulfocurvibacter africanus subsp. africanus str. Walvis Bay TaxID=690850 RepID=F3YY64_DESAF|nr:hypothetical protein [Desulfocurvibacter africanus]EGJ51840.1 hypothetical protein Desaf_3560 [Desulfocurvibacter africanus subsp. africanus str. Walvis Bay]